MTLIAAADGSALSNPGPMGWSWYIDDDRWAAGGAPHGTNNQGELLAVLELLRATDGLDDDLLIECDSRYVIDSITRWMPGWKKRGWRKADGGPVLNRELMEALDAALQHRRVRFEWVKGHAGHPRNEAADARANAAATAYRDRAEPARGPGFGTPKAPVTRQPATPPATLWDDEPIAEPVNLTLTLTPEEFDRLSARARAAGIPPEELLRQLI